MLAFTGKAPAVYSMRGGRFDSSARPGMDDYLSKPTTVADLSAALALHSETELAATT